MLNDILNRFTRKTGNEITAKFTATEPEKDLYVPKIIALWGNPSSGKTVTAMKLAKELAAKKKNVIVIFADIFCPVLSTVIPSCDTKNRTLGSLLSKPSIKQSDIMEKSIPYPKNDYIAVMGYKNGDNIFTYSDFLRERVLDFFTQLRQVADYIIIDCSSVLTEDGFSTLSLEYADKVLRLCSADLKSYSYFSSHLPLLADQRFKTDKHIKILSNLKTGQEENTFRGVYGDITYTLPHVAELENQYYSASLLDGLSGKEAKQYEPVIKKIVKEVFLIA